MNIFTTDLDVKMAGSCHGQEPKIQAPPSPAFYQIDLMCVWESNDFLGK